MPKFKYYKDLGDIFKILRTNILKGYFFTVIIVLRKEVYNEKGYQFITFNINFYQSIQKSRPKNIFSIILF